VDGLSFSAVSYDLASISYRVPYIEVSMLEEKIALKEKVGVFDARCS